MEELYSEGNISNSVYKFFKDVLKYQNQEKQGKVEINYTYKLEKQEKIKMTQELSDILTEHFQGDIKYINLVLEFIDNANLLKLISIYLE